MGNSYRTSGATSTGANWRAGLEQLEKARAELRDYGHMMSDYERLTAQRAVDELKERVTPSAQRGMLNEYYGALETWQAAGRELDRHTAREIASWEPAKLRDELQLTRMFVDQALRAGREAPAELARIYREAKQSGDRYKIRAAAEIVRGAFANFDGSAAELNERVSVKRLTDQAEHDLAELRTTDAMRSGAELRSQAWEQFLTRRAELQSTGLALDGVDPSDVFATGALATAMKRVQADAAGRVHVLDENDPAVTGIYLKKPPVVVEATF